MKNDTVENICVTVVYVAFFSTIAFICKVWCENRRR